jgi:hypothetical protein
MRQSKGSHHELILEALLINPQAMAATMIAWLSQRYTQGNSLGGFAAKCDG